MQTTAKNLSDVPAINRFLSYCRVRTVPSKTVMIHAGDLPSMDTVATHLEHTQADVRERFIALFAAADDDRLRSSLGGDSLEGENK